MGENIPIAFDVTFGCTTSILSESACVGAWTQFRLCGNSTNDYQFFGRFSYIFVYVTDHPWDVHSYGGADYQYVDTKVDDRLMVG